MNKKNERQGMFEPATIDDEIILCLNKDQPAEAAKLFRQMNTNNEPLLAAIADMLDGDPKTNRGLTQQYNYRLKLATWGLKGRKPKGSTAKAKNNAGYKPKREPIKVNQAMVRPR